MIYLLDTDHSSILQRGGPSADILSRRLRSVSRDDYGTSIVSYEEQCRGWTAYINRASSSEQRVDGYRRLRASLRFYGNIAVWQYDEAADELYLKMAAAKVRVGTKDLRIASIALANDATLLTRNSSDFNRVANLRFEDWSV